MSLGSHNGEQLPLLWKQAGGDPQSLTVLCDQEDDGKRTPQGSWGKFQSLHLGILPSKGLLYHGSTGGAEGHDKEGTS